MTPLPKRPRRRNSAPVISRYSRWIRLYTSVRNDPKIVRLSDVHFRTWITLLQVAGEQPDGILPSMQDLACELRCTPPRAEQLIDDLIDWGLIDIVERTGDGPILQPHNWTARQYKSDNDTSTERVRKHRDKKHQDTVQRFSNADETKNQHFLSESESVYQDGRSSSEVSNNTCNNDKAGYWGDDGEWRACK